MVVRTVLEELHGRVSSGQYEPRRPGCPAKGPSGPVFINRSVPRELKDPSSLFYRERRREFPVPAAEVWTNNYLPRVEDWALSSQRSPVHVGPLQWPAFATDPVYFLDLPDEDVVEWTNCLVKHFKREYRLSVSTERSYHQSPGAFAQGLVCPDRDMMRLVPYVKIVHFLWCG